MFTKATRTKAKLRLALCGPSGSGKTWGALELAHGLGGKVALIDTERGSASLYADAFEFDVLELAPPFTPARYNQAIKGAVDAGYTTLIIDSLSHAWSGEGGILEMVDSAAKASRSGNSFNAWREVTPEHNSLVDGILSAGVHIIATMRTKTAYEIVENDKGKKEPRKIGLAPVQRDGMEYEFTCVLDLSVEGNIATASKDRTRLFAGRHVRLTKEIGAELFDWLETGQMPEDPHISRKLELLAELASAGTIGDLQVAFGQTKIFCNQFRNDTFLEQAIAAKDKRKAELTQPMEKAA